MFHRNMIPELFPSSFLYRKPITAQKRNFDDREAAKNHARVHTVANSTRREPSLYILVYSAAKDTINMTVDCVWHGVVDNVSAPWRSLSDTRAEMTVLTSRMSYMNFNLSIRVSNNRAMLQDRMRCKYEAASSIGYHGIRGLIWIKERCDGTS
jgi:hypothetical protein